MTQDDVAARLDIDRRQIGRIESAQKPVSVFRLIQICNALEVDAGDLLREVQERVSHEG